MSQGVRFEERFCALPPEAQRQILDFMRLHRKQLLAHIWGQKIAFLPDFRVNSPPMWVRVAISDKVYK